MNSDTVQQKTPVKEIMSNSVISVDSSVTATDAAKMMEDSGVGAITVLENGSPVGIVTDRDFAIKITAHSYPIDTPIRRIMSSPLISINPDSDLWTASDLMSTRNIRKLPVIDDDRIIGIITSGDLVKYFASL
ncbi:Inosine-5'-monophosphate dehydrogenase protein [Marine Group I thaumarchaeote SCGC AAA799-E16]|uniref:Inosine-5'-monophosphate dehydrogenase protein n=4 Tax=Marine Group I TaxID=905826 RepID=A0A081RM42_9ARCH|nr:Inosine-5'-monophosphate dehydrogenase protein [Marine Group I thaumarchaeote SCGC AAA799-N04]KER06163.1 Inosine-5'-monophosphate dehydrogenase protein [Marine Group I thaumarchaeote SCGC AAA799-E16]KFM15546.1 Inosine-5'-monophosphate dehydrogenase protein [Marine Group I thaumarchaeote SCGC AAA799-D11]KFM19227.1 Inosine-5'-monophosphate dehydrogenase protein [Marine Group I thaumarchaeote SCGC RSA3]